MNNRLASTMLPGFRDTVEPPHLTSEYFKTLSQQEKEQAWKDWANICYKYMKEREEADKLYEECIDKYFGREVKIFRECVNEYLEGDIKMKNDKEESQNE